MSELNKKYNYGEIIAWIEQKGLELFGPHFKILQSDLPILYPLIAYFLKDEQSAFQYNIDLNKGILLAGPVGCGKTSLMTIMKHLTPIEHKFALKPCRDISFEFIADGYRIIHDYSKETRARGGHNVASIYCFDDLGIESSLKYYGNECNVMAEVLLGRYDCFVNKRIPTHLTTNLSASEIEKYYGLRVRSRLRAMMNLIAYDKNTKDKR
jgi:energy-coupling factor transporter ATP-binding protein EcfA2